MSVQPAKMIAEIILHAQTLMEATLALVRKGFLTRRLHFVRTLMNVQHSLIFVEPRLCVPTLWVAMSASVSRAMFQGSWGGVKM